MAGEGMFTDIPVEIGVVFEGERIRKQSMHAELGGPSVSEKFELLEVVPSGDITDGTVHLIGPDLADMEPGTVTPFAIHIRAAGASLEGDMESVMERRIHDFCNWIEGFMHLNQRNAIWLRADKRSVGKGLSLRHVGIVLARLYKSALPIIDEIEVTLITDPGEVRARYARALGIYEQRDARSRGMTDEDVDVFYGCSLCQSFAPSHVCVITPQRYANCGAIGWLDGRAAARVDPKGPIYEIPKGECLDPIAGEYEGVNLVVREKSLSDISRVQLYTAFGYPHTSCGCFECTTFYVPECDGLGIVNRDFRGSTPTGLTFGTIADSTGGGRQVEGFHGLSYEYMRSPRFLQGSGGWERVVWMPAAVRAQLKEYIPDGLRERIATEEDVTSVEALMDFLRSREHPILSTREQAPAIPESVEQSPGRAVLPAKTGAGQNPGTGVVVTFRNVTIRADRIFVNRKMP
ncbi:MAG: CO dehydrogenase/CO-methylating acetyl-CoA synthase complex subunit beta [Methanoregulaceae archaeon]|nr:CO dehydrogenase/CO-methylating acetyl-CoA synthase complex subunit beta [Methanoregulaceae archaeon]